VALRNHADGSANKTTVGYSNNVIGQLDSLKR